MLSVAYARQISANGGQIDNLKASQRQMQGCADLDVLSVRLVGHFNNAPSLPNRNLMGQRELNLAPFRC